MKIEEILESAFVVKPDDTLSHVVARMTEEKRYEAFVFDGESRGIVTMDDIIRKNVSEPQKMKISYFMKPINVFSIETPAEDIINYMLVSEYRSLPVEKDGKIYAITKPKLLGFIKDEVFEGKNAEDIMQKPFCVKTDDSLNTVLSVIKDGGNNRVPVIDDKGKFAGLVDSLSLSGIIIGRERLSLGARSDGEKSRIGDLNISKFATTDVVSVGPEESVKKIVKEMSSKEVYNVVVEDDGKFMGIITIKDILKLIGKSLETVYIRVSGLGDEDEFVRKKVDELIEKSIQKVLKVIRVSYVVIHVETHKKKEKSDSKKYSVQGRFVTDKGNFYANDYEWEPISATKIFLERMETEIFKQVSKERGR
ncbi:MAG: CBS domain-containing protein [Candidatus Aenigmarchaeota archaeon]|nr:CBS domain-containing protein [Candidatus Aenigmarchaeota archaeon]